MDEELSTNGTLIPELKELASKGISRMSANLIANGCSVRKQLKMPDFCNYAIQMERSATVEVENTGVLGLFLRDVMGYNTHNFGVIGPDATVSNRLSVIYEVTKKNLVSGLSTRR